MNEFLLGMFVSIAAWQTTQAILRMIYVGKEFTVESADIAFSIAIALLAMLAATLTYTGVIA